MTPSFALILALATSPPGTPTPSPTAFSSSTPALSVSPTPSTTPITAPGGAHGQFLTITPTYLVFTTGDAVPLDPDTQVAPGLRLGQTIRVRFDPQSHHVRSVEAARGPAAPDEVDAAQLPHSYLAVSSASARSTENTKAAQQAKIVNVTFMVEVPDDTPAGDDIYLSTERSNFSPAELKMNRIDAHRWSSSLPLVQGTTLHYQYTRGNYATVERDASGGVSPPHAIEIHDALHTKDTVARWADTS